MCDCDICRASRSNSPYDYFLRYGRYADEIGPSFMRFDAYPRPVFDMRALEQTFQPTVRYRPGCIVRVATPSGKIYWLSDGTIRNDMTKAKDAGAGTDNLLVLAHWIIKRGVTPLLGEVFSNEMYRDMSTHTSAVLVKMDDYQIEFFKRRVD